MRLFFGYSNYALVWFNDGYFSSLVEYNPLLHTWSLAVEGQFYFLFPFLYYFWMKEDSSSRKANNLGFIIMLLLTILSFGYSIYATHSDPTKAYYLLTSRFWEISCGVLLFMLHSKGQFYFKTEKHSEMGLWAGLTLIVTGFLYANSRAFPYPWAVLSVIGTITTITGVVSSQKASSLPHTVLKSKALIYIGKISYSLYFCHWVIAVFLRWTIGFESLSSKIIYLVLSLLLANVTYLYVEKPLRKNNWINTQKHWKIVVAGVLVLVMARGFSGYIIEQQNYLSLSTTKDEYTWYPYKHDQDGPDDPIIIDPKNK